MKPAFWLYMLIVFIGFVIVVLPDSNERLFSLSESHGPSLLDAAGLTMVLVPWLIMGMTAVMEWRKVALVLGRRMVTILLAAGLTGLLLVVIAVRSSSDYWMLGATIAFVAQLVLIVTVFRKR